MKKGCFTTEQKAYSYSHVGIRLQKITHKNNKNLQLKMTKAKR